MGLFTKPERKIASKKSKLFPKDREAEAYKVQFPIYYDADAYQRNNTGYLNNGHQLRFPHPDLFFAGEMQLKDATKFLDNKLYNPLKKRFVPSYRQLLQRQVFPDDDRVQFSRNKNKVEERDDGEVLKKLAMFKKKLAKQESVSDESRAINRAEMFSHLDQMVKSQEEGRSDDEGGSHLFFFKKRKQKKHKPIRRDKRKEIEQMEDSIQAFAQFDEGSDSDDEDDVVARRNNDNEVDMTGSWAIDLDTRSNDPLARLRRRSLLKPSTGKVIRGQDTGSNSMVRRSFVALRESFRMVSEGSKEEQEARDGDKGKLLLTPSRSDEAESEQRHPPFRLESGIISELRRGSFSFDFFHNSDSFDDVDSERTEKFSGPTVREVFGLQSGYDEQGRRWTHRLVQAKDNQLSAKEIAREALSVADRAHCYALDKMNGKPLDLDLLGELGDNSFQTKPDCPGNGHAESMKNQWAQPLQDEPEFHVPKITFTADRIDEANDEDDDEDESYTGDGDSLGTDPSVSTNASAEDIEHKAAITSVLRMIERSASNRELSTRSSAASVNQPDGK